MPIREIATMPVRLTRSRRPALAAVLSAAGFIGTVWAHHSFAMFDMSKTITIEGTVKEFQWTNPHAWIEVMVQAPDGPKQYSIETHNVIALTDAGWKFNSLKPGDKVTVVMNPLRNGTAGGGLVSAKLADGRILTVGF